MASGMKKLTTNNISTSVSSGSSCCDLTGKISNGGGSSDHNRLLNRELENQHPIEAITDLRTELDSKLSSKTAMPLINEALGGKAKGLYFDALKELARKSYWYLTAEIDPVTKLGTKDSIISGPYDLGAGGGSGGGGGGGVTTVSIKPQDWPTSTVVGAKTELAVNWSSVIGEDRAPTGKGTLYFSVNGKQIEVRPNQEQGVVYFDVSKHLVPGSNTIQVKVLDMYGTTGITINTLNAVTLELKSDFNANLNYTGTVNYTYTPYGDVDKTVYFIIDGGKPHVQMVKSTGESQTFQLPKLTHGAHTLEVYFTAAIGDEIKSSNTLFYDLIYYVNGDKTPIIASDFNTFDQEQYISFRIPYKVFVAGKNSFDVALKVNGETVQNLTVGAGLQFWEYKNDVPGDYDLTIACGKVSRTFTVHIAKSTVDVQPVSVDLALGLSAQGRLNSEPAEQRCKWEDTVNKVSCELTNFNWSSNGWCPANDVGTVLRVSGDARVKIPYAPFKDEFKSRGKTIELEIATSAVRNYSSTIISCLDKSSTDFYAAEATFVEDTTRLKGFDIEINPEKIKDIGLTLGSHVITYTDAGWTYEGAPITLDDWGITLTEKTLNIDGSGENFVYIGDNIAIDYSLKARGFYVTPQAAVFRSQQSQLSSQYKEDEHVRLAFVIERNTSTRIIWMYINGIASGAVQYPLDDSFRQLEPSYIELGSNDAILDIYNIRIYDNSLTSAQIINNWVADTQDAVLRVQRYTRNNNYNDKNEIVVDKLPADLPYIIWDIQPLPEYKGDKRLGNARYVDPAFPERNFTAENAQYNVQGTSSAVYPVKNIRTKYKAKDGDPMFAWYDDNGDDIKKFPITYPGGIGDNYFTFKVDYASSEGANNVELVKLYNDACKVAGILTPPQKAEAQKNGGDTSKVQTRVGIDGFPIVAFHKDADGNITFASKANFNNDKANEDVYGFADGDECWEITNNSAAEGKFQIPVNAENLVNGFEIRFPDVDGYSDIAKLAPMTEWIVSTYRKEATNDSLPEPVTFTYTESNRAEDGSFSTVEVTKTFETDSEEYRLTKFKAELADWFDVKSSLFYYIFTSLFLQIDSRAKNAFPAYFASRVPGDGGDRWFWLPYDMDTSIGIDNKGKLVFDYNLEDTDQINGSDVYNGQDSVFWNNIRDAFSGEIAELYSTLRTQKLISYEHVNQMFLDHQGKWTESIFNEDAKVKYVRPLADGKNYLEMLQGSKAQQRMWWLYNRFRYMDSKYNTGDAKSDYIQFRAYVDENVEKPNITVTPYADIYATVSFANSKVGTKAKRAKRNEPITLENPFKLNEKETDQETYIYSASQLKSIGDISPFYPDTVDVGNAIKLQDLKIGSGAEGYVNPNLTSLALGANTLLRSLDVRNCINLTQAIDITKCINIEEIYFSGTKITGIMLPDGGNIKKLYLPNTLTKLTLKNQPLLEDLQLAGTENMESLWLENIPATSIKSYEMVDKLKPNSAVRIIGMNETYQNWEEIEVFYNKLDTMKGLDSEGEVVDKAQVTGTIHIEHVPYERYQDYIARYPEVIIDSKSVVCNVIFMNEDTVHELQPVGKGFLPVRPADPQKAPTQKNYWTFNRWVDEDGELWDETAVITKNTTLYAVYDEYVQQYTISYNVDSIVISVDPPSVTDYYGSTVAAPICNNIPEGVELIGWFAPDGSRWTFEGGENANQILENITLIARWSDSNTPIVWTERKDYETFTYAAQDNLGIVGWRVTLDTEDVPEIWNEIDCTTEIHGEYKISGPGTYRFWVTDRNGNIISTSQVAYPITTDLGTGIEVLELLEDAHIVSSFALEGTQVEVSVSIDEHYKNLQIFVNDEEFMNHGKHQITGPLDIRTICVPKDYKVSFVTWREEDGITIPSQTITYLHKATFPTVPYNAGYIIGNWHRNRELTDLWDFEVDVIENDITLYAEWVEYRTPTKLTIQVPNGSVAERTIKVNYQQNRKNDVKVDFGDGSPQESSAAVYTNYSVATISHTYETGGTYIVEIWGTPYGYRLGGGQSSRKALMPSEYITDIEFAWDVATTEAHAFEGAAIKQLKLTDYMTEIADYAFYNCTELETLNIPNTITYIGNQAFDGCTGLTGDVYIPASVAQVGSRVFAGTSALHSIKFAENGNLREISNAFAASSGITEITIPDYVDHIVSHAFSTCRKLTKVVLLNPNLTMDKNVFLMDSKLEDVGPINWDLGPGQSDIYDIEFAWTTKIPDNAFGGDKVYNRIRTVTLPEGLLEIGNEAFSGCSYLKQIELPSSLLTIGNDAFYLSSLGSISIPASVTSVGTRAFGCSALGTANLYFLSSICEIEAPTLGWFYGCSGNLKVGIPAQLVDAEFTANIRYGTYWNVYDYDTINNVISYLDYFALPQD